ncbi:K+dependent Na+ exchanger related-protein [Halogeometricum borinquense DSM 11551]|uniref:K+dependent Na+ exchanger related-protein n=2 Tax=Halogeometricum borinquense TaxID=60847 RepID=E4NU90_HALBP|nr:sodium:calcium antiporter [Halogeometricum borinquense]ADQ68610.1 K+dependent Na+ exchanger related-protein [Halogeometricum borinquense DSM 11551]ELY25518.1 K+dependent Na+ exchanger related-protein [Halogeometricum borinquense DSM 11551]RYJ08590.1 sodium:calcium antiporter [Halogeometricum borinquense]
MILELGGFVVGLGILLVGADRTVRSAAELALYYGVSNFFVGVTVVSIGTSIPEMTTSLYAAYYGAGDLVVGNIVGSETAQITLGIGIVALISPIVAERKNVLVYGGAMLLSMIIMILTLEDGITRSEGILMMLAYAIFIHDLYSNEGGEEITEEVIEEQEPPKRTVPWVLFGLLLVVGGGQVMVTNGVALATLLGIPPYVVGILTGLGTTAPEIVVAGIAARSGRSGISVGSLLGSNITDPVFSLGIGALVADVTLSDPESVTMSVSYMLFVSLIVIAVLYWRRGIDRRSAIGCLLLYLPSFIVL